MVNLKNYLAVLRKQKFVPHSISLGELEKFFIDNSAIPEDENKGFVVSYETIYDDPSCFSYFCFFNSSIKLSD